MSAASAGASRSAFRSQPGRQTGVRAGTHSQLGARPNPASPGLARRCWPSVLTNVLTITVAAAACLALLSACGGGSGGSDATPPVTPVTPAPAPLTVTGTAATGAALAGRLVDAKCASGTATATASASATTKTDGTFSLAISDGKLPCVLRVNLADGGYLHSLATGAAATATANLTPASELVVARLAGSAAADFFGSFDASKVSDTTVQAALTAVVATLKAGGVDVTALGNLLTAPLMAANGMAAGNDFDKALDALKAKLDASGAKLADLASSVALASPNAPAATLSNTASLPADLLLRPAAPNCAALRSGRYRLVINSAGQNGGHATEVISVDAPKLTVTNPEGKVFQLTANGSCRFRTPGGGDLVVSQAGVGVFQNRYNADDQPFSGTIALPEQSHTVAELAGDWNQIGLDRTTDNGPIHLTAANVSLDSAGKLTAFTFCDKVLTCTTTANGADFPKLTITAAADGGFDVTHTSPVYTDRLFAYRSGGGELMWVTLAAPGHITFGSRKGVNALPTVGRVSESFNLTLTPQYTAPFAINDSKNTITSVNSAAGTFERSAVFNTTTGATRNESFVINQPRDGFGHRLGATTTGSDGSSTTVQEFVSLGLRGTGVSMVGFVASNQLVMSVGKP